MMMLLDAVKSEELLVHQDTSNEQDIVLEMSGAEHRERLSNNIWKRGML